MRDQLLEKIFRWLRFHKVVRHVPEGSVLCDIGCGHHCTFLDSVKSKLSRGIGLDQDVVGGQYNNIDLVNANLEKPLSLSSESVDVVSILAVLEHIENDAAMLKECLRILKPGGLLLITVPTHINQPVGEFLAYKLKLLEESGYRDHKRYYSKAKLRRDLKDAGFVGPHLIHWELGMNLFAKAYKPA